MSKIQDLFSRSTYLLSDPRVQIAKAKNTCRHCKAAIKKGEKYILCFGWDHQKHPFGKRRSPQPWTVTLKLCKECSVELLKMKPIPNKLLFPKNFEQKVLEAIREMVYYRNRFNFLTGRDPAEEFLKKKGILK